MKYTAAILESLGACYTTAFAALFPDGAELTRDNLLKAAEGGLDIGWFAERVLSGNRRDEFIKLTNLALAEYDRSFAGAWHRYQGSTAAVGIVHSNLFTPLTAYEYKKLVVALRHKYNKAIAPALADALGLP